VTGNYRYDFFFSKCKQDIFLLEYDTVGTFLGDSRNETEIRLMNCIDSRKLIASFLNFVFLLSFGTTTAFAGSFIANSSSTVSPFDQYRAAARKRPYAKVLKMGNDSSKEEVGVTEDDKDGDIRNASSSSSEKMMHFCFLVHGWLGTHREMGSIHTAFEEAYENDASHVDKDKHKIVVHSVRCNDNNTSDGIRRGGKRVADEVKEFMRQYLMDHAELANNSITISFIGNSLGGLYSRYAISLIDCDLLKRDLIPEDLSYEVFFNVFCTTATPHLGESRNTYIPIPRFVEKVIGAGIGETGNDLFGSNSLLREMSMDDQYLSPLRTFRKRIAYANAFGTDFPVPTATAAFLHNKSDYPHVIENNPSFHSVLLDSSSDNLFFARFCCEQRPIAKRSPENPNGDYMLQMSNNLDELGWTKVFVDTRDQLPFGSFWIPFGSDGRKVFSEWCDGGSLGENSFESKQVLSVFSSQNTIQMPAGHTVLIANSKSSLYSFLNRKGKPIVKYLVSEILNTIVSFER